MGRRLPVPLTPAEIDRLLQAAAAAIAEAETPARRRAAARDLAMIETGRLSGLRVSELCSLKIEHLDLDGQVLPVLRGKGGKDRNLPIADKLLAALSPWIGERKTGFLFSGPREKKLSPRTFQVRLDKLARRAGILKRVHPHQLRHTFATSYLRIAGNSIRDLQQLLGHANLQTTAVYLHVDVSRLKAGVDLL